MSNPNVYAKENPEKPFRLKDGHLYFPVSICCGSSLVLLGLFKINDKRQVCASCKKACDVKARVASY